MEKFVLKEINSTDNDIFKESMKIYEQSFPLKERQSIDLIISRFNEHKYRIFVGMNKNEPIVFALVYYFTNCNFMLLDYYAVRSDFRGKGIGSQFLSELFLLLQLTQNLQFIVLEVEDPRFGDVPQEKSNRIRFYKRLGIKEIKNVQYILPPLSGTEFTEMIMMIYPEPNITQFSSDVCKNIVTELYIQKYNRDPNDVLLKKKSRFDSYDSEIYLNILIILFQEFFSTCGRQIKFQLESVDHGINENEVNFDKDKIKLILNKLASPIYQLLIRFQSQLGLRIMDLLESLTSGKNQIKNYLDHYYIPNFRTKKEKVVINYLFLPTELAKMI